MEISAVLLYLNQAIGAGSGALAFQPHIQKLSALFTAIILPVLFVKNAGICAVGCDVSQLVIIENDNSGISPAALLYPVFFHLQAVDCGFAFQVIHQFPVSKDLPAEVQHGFFKSRVLPQRLAILFDVKAAIALKIRDV